MRLPAAFSTGPGGQRELAALLHFDDFGRPRERRLRRGEIFLPAREHLRAGPRSVAVGEPDDVGRDHASEGLHVAVGQCLRECDLGGAHLLGVSSAADSPRRTQRLRRGRAINRVVTTFMGISLHTSAADITFGIEAPHGPPAQCAPPAESRSRDDG